MAHNKLNIFEAISKDTKYIISNLLDNKFYLSSNFQGRQNKDFESFNFFLYFTVFLTTLTADVRAFMGNLMLEQPTYT